MMRQFIISVCLIGAFVLAGQAAKAQSVVLPLELDANGHLRVPVTFENGESYDFILDTAASRTGLMQSLVEVLELEPDENEAGVLHGSTGESRIDMYPPMTLKVGGVLSYETPLLPAMGHLAIPGEPFYGILGSDFFEQYVVEIDAIGGRLVLTKGSASALVGDGDFAIVPIRPHPGGIWMLDTMIGDVKVTSFLDTGARGSILNPATAEALGIQLPHSFADGNEEISGATGHQARGIGLQLDEISAGERIWEKPQITVADIHVFDNLQLNDQPAMILGSDLLFQGRLIIDYKSRLVYIERT